MKSCDNRRLAKKLQGWIIRTGYPKLRSFQREPVTRTDKKWWKLFTWYRKYKLYGYTDLKSKEIIIHPYYLKLMDQKEVRNLLYHEVAHAVAEEGHTSKWRYYCRKFTIPTTAHTVIKKRNHKKVNK